VQERTVAIGENGGGIVWNALKRQWERDTALLRWDKKTGPTPEQIAFAITLVLVVVVSGLTAWSVTVR
jgi:hypothetical protein